MKLTEAESTNFATKISSFFGTEQQNKKCSN